MAPGIDLPGSGPFFEIRFESIGGLGAHAAGQVIAAAAVLRMGLNGSHFSSYGSEKKGQLNDFESYSAYMLRQSSAQDLAAEDSLQKQLSLINFKVCQEIRDLEKMHEQFKGKQYEQMVSLLAFYLEECQLQRCQPTYIKKMLANMQLMNYQIVLRGPRPEGKAVVVE